MKPTFWRLIGVMLLAGIQNISAQATPNLDAMILAIEQAQVNAEKLQQAIIQEGYETDKEFEARKAEALTKSKEPAVIALQTAISELERTVFSVTSDKVTLQAQPFDREAKTWTFYISSQDKTVPYSGKVVRSIAGNPNMKAAFDPVDRAIKEGTLAVRIEYRVRTEGAGEYQLRGLKAHFASDGVELFSLPLEASWIIKGASEAVRTVEKYTPQPTNSIPSQTLRGSERGNSYEMTIEAISGTAGRSLYEPIWLYMPLPYELSNSIYAAIPDRAGLPGTAAQRREQFAKVYELVSGTWWLRKGPLPGFQPAYEARPALWVMLEDAGYEIESAEYKTMNRLREITLLFRVLPYHPERGVELNSVHIERSSGISTVDDAVIYAFSKAEFSNSGVKSVNGRLTYRF